jgi:hypothetical protein
LNIKIKPQDEKCPKTQPKSGLADVPDFCDQLSLLSWFALGLAPLEPTGKGIAVLRYMPQCTVGPSMHLR